MGFKEFFGFGKKEEPTTTPQEEAPKITEEVKTPEAPEQTAPEIKPEDNSNAVAEVQEEIDNMPEKTEPAEDLEKVA